MDIGDLDDDPLRQLGTWIEEARAGGDAIPEAMCLATAGAGGAPSARMVLLRGLDTGLAFFTDYGSAKAADLAANSRAAVVFHLWAPEHRQVRASGPVARVSGEESDRYWATRPVASRWSALASHQSTVVEGREALERAVAAVSADPDPRRPDRWGGFRLTPDEVEFWAEGAARLHDRLRYRRKAGAWIVERLSP